MSSDKHITALRQIQEIVSEALRGTAATSDRKKQVRQKPPEPPRTTAQLSFDMSPLAFMNKYARGLSGPKKFTLLLARMVKGSTTAQLPYQDIAAQWNKMKTVLGGPCNPAFGNRANAAGWVYSEKGHWKLTGDWKEALASVDET